ncbi:MAG: hypothetical protein H6813_07150 [Phycisphaeraceae bacterium]|nr:hypothetical protein [Phycisphaeraceae bacterium]MCB9848274.1 hypothetical protein [Phycisphaeraceae bacterium]
MKPACCLNLVVFASLLGAGPASGALRLVGTAPDSDFNVPTTSPVARMAMFSGIIDPVSGVGITARYTTVAGDFGGGVGPWSLDVTMDSESPTGAMGNLFNPISGDITIADYPFQDGAFVLPFPVSGDGTWLFSFGSTEPNAGWTYGLRDVSYHLLTLADDVTTMYDATPDAGQQWDRPYFIEGVSGQGPVAYHVLAFTVDTPGVYEFTSVLSSGNNHFTFLYRDGFDPQLPLQNLLDYGLGNGFAQNGDPSGTSSFDALLKTGETYYWVTSQWAFFSAIETAHNTLVGPGAPVVLVPCSADLNGDGVVDTADLGVLLGAFGTNDAQADLNDDGMVDTADLGILLGEFGSHCA